MLSLECTRIWTLSQLGCKLIYLHIKGFPPPRLQPTYAKMLNSKSLPVPLREMWRGGMTILIDIGSLGLVAILNFHRFLDSMGVLKKI